MAESAHALSAWESFYVIGGSALSLLLVGIHNAWDSITHIAVTSGRTE